MKTNFGARQVATQMDPNTLADRDLCLLLLLLLLLYYSQA